MKELIKIFIVTIFICGCYNSNKTRIIGAWIILQMTYKETNLADDLNLNNIHTQNGIDYVLPIIPKLYEHSNAMTGRANYFKRLNENYIYFQTQNQFFNDTFAIKFIGRDTLEFSNLEKYIKFYYAGSPRKN